MHGNCPEEFINVVRLLEESTGSVAVGQIGRSVILYRPSLSKLKKEETPKPAISAKKPRSYKKPYTANSRSDKPGNNYKFGSSKKGPRASWRKP